MTPRTNFSAIALLAGAFVVAACGGTAATNAPATQSAVATLAPATQAPGSSDGTSPSFALPSFHANTTLEKVIPTEIGGEAITTMSVSGADLIGVGSSQELSAVLTALHKQPSDLSAAFGGNTLIEIVAFQVNGVSGGQILDAFNAATQSGATITDASFGGKSVKKIATTTGDPTYVYTKDDIVFSVGGAAITDALLNEAFSKLP